MHAYYKFPGETAEMNAKIALSWMVISLLVFLNAYGSANKPSRSDNPLSASELFAKANQLYQQGKFKESAQLYQRLIAMGYNSPTLWYNLGNAYVKSGQTGKAVVAYERALRFAPRDSDLRENLLLISPPENLRKPFILLRPFVAFINYFSLNELFMLCEIFYVCTCLMLIASLLRLLPIARRLIKPVLILFVLFLIFFAVNFYQEVMTTYGVIVHDKTIARSGPGNEFTEIMVLPEGTKFRLLAEQSDGWAKIRIPDGLTGFVPSSAFEKI